MKYKLIGKNLKEDIGREVLNNRGIDDDYQHFLNPVLEDVYSYSLLANIDAAAALLDIHIKKKSKIGIVVDSDCDGLCSAATLWNFIHKDVDPEADLEFFVHEGKEHGLDKATYQKIIDAKINLLIIPDAGSNDTERIKYLLDLKIDIIILDHHDMEDPLHTMFYKDFGSKFIKEKSYCYIINNQASVSYPNKELCGAGVVWQFIRCYNDRYLKGKADAFYYLDLVAVALVADMMDTRSLETRYLINYGCKHIYNLFFIGICQENSFSMKGKVNPTTVGWYVAPLFNAMCRSGTNEDKEGFFKAMLIENEEKVVLSTKRGAGTFAQEKYITQQIRNAKNVKSRQDRNIIKIFAETEEYVKASGILKNKILIIKSQSKDLAPEIIGLLANKIAQKYQHPTLVVREREKGILSGSGRNYANCPIEDFRAELAKTGFTTLAQGHPSAFGVAFMEENIDNITDYFNKKYKDLDMMPAYRVDFEFDAEKENDKILQAAMIIGTMDEKGIFGQGLEEPKILVKNVPVDAGSVTLMSPDKHPTLRIDVGKNFNVVKFHSSQDEYAEFETEGHQKKSVDLIATCHINEWMGRKTPQLMAVDYELKKAKGYAF